MVRAGKVFILQTVSTTVVAVLLAVVTLVALFFVFKWRQSSAQLGVTQQSLDHFELSYANSETARARSEAAHAEIVAKYQNVIDVDLEVSRLREIAEQQQDDIEGLRASYSDKRGIYDRLLSELAIFDDRLAFAEMGVYEPHFDFKDSDDYKVAISNIRDEQKAMITSKTAVYCTTKWHVEGSIAKGQTMTNRNIRLTLRAFNNEADAAISSARWNNVNAMEKRIIRAFEQIDKMNVSNTIYIAPDFLKLKLTELYLTHEYREKLKMEKDDRAESLRLAKDEQRLIRDMEEAEEQEAHYARMLSKAKEEAASIAGTQLDAFSDQIAILERDLAEAHAKAERAKAMAERTRSGYVYIISNIGSFGDGVVKIGLTRRLDPLDRVRELGDASVPFLFDVHAVIYSDDAPALERALHLEFDAVRVNAQNYRKEFFRAKIDEVHSAVQRLAPTATFFKDVEAQEYQETLSRRRIALENTVTSAGTAFPSAI